jgi:prevent-host-death family protein
METISISNLKAHLSATIKRVRAGNRVVVVDRDIPVAEITPYPHRKRGISIRRALKKKMSGSIHLGARLDVDPADYLLEDRRRDRQ